MKKLNVAIIGQGRSGYLIHGAHFKLDTERFAVKYVVDAIEARRKKAEQEFGCETLESYIRAFDGGKAPSHHARAGEAPDRGHPPLPRDEPASNV